MRILVVCGAGASSTFVAQRLRQAATAAGRDWQTAAGTEGTISSAFADLILIGPHLAERLSVIRDATDTPVALLPSDVFGDRDGTTTLAIVDAALSAAPPDAATSTHLPSTAKGTP
ncbi:PTS sugar transporter subunit IIB [Microbacterium paludicola]|uniref:PTS sugar transporter subunit IIB n=1 Tax=Microbacterium paludicola TaxID=300019 RepID=UPI00119CE426|nr:hypothetical protein [Microbacterium paludicola]